MDMTAGDYRKVFAHSEDSLVDARAKVRRTLVGLEHMSRGVNDASRNSIEESLDLLGDVNQLAIAADKNPELAAEWLLSGYAALSSLTANLEESEVRAELKSYLDRVSATASHLTGTYR